MKSKVININNTSCDRKSRLTRREVVKQQEKLLQQCNKELLKTGTSKKSNIKSPNKKPRKAASPIISNEDNESDNEESLWEFIGTHLVENIVPSHDEILDSGIREHAILKC